MKNVYWSIWSDPEVTKAYQPGNFHQPKNLFTQISKIKLPEDSKPHDFRICPAVKDQTRNTFVLSFPFDYNLFFDKEKNTAFSNMYDQSFYDDIVYVRSVEHNLCSIKLHYIFISEEPLEMSFTGAYFSDNEFTRRTLLIPGQYDIGKWPRPLDCAFMIRNGYSDVVFNQGDDYAYVRFLTNETVNLQKFYATQHFNDLVSEFTTAKRYVKKHPNPLGYWYNLYKESKYHTRILTEIKSNLL